MSNDNWIQYSRQDKVGVITLNRSPVNAYNFIFHQQLNTLLTEVEQDEQVNCVIFRSSSEKFFCAGADIKEFQANSTKANQQMVDMARANLALLDQSKKIYIAEVAGHCMGGGLEIALACDFRFAAEGSYLIGMSEIKLGLIPGNGGTQRLVRLIGKVKALELLLTGDNISPQTAHQLGLLNCLHPKAELAQVTLDFALKLAFGPALANAATKQAVSVGAELSLADGLKLEHQLADALCHSQDAKEGFVAFVEKRTPVYCGK
ncbi:enoyl-CoA hydratase/isomerase family protein [Vibrio sp. CK2-1]|uniref:enoyl-CoA hydratase/isomerase family protein n=1 Tax=Vibrio sp. CK2-1 TaxID=2912249 RepID=UPI001F1F79F9|nr:enoyl-CoA hydratase/isomerase family protein [Vibrio sp. CK2-1]MCF7352971.1 enoyl-CoA hydratase/isomerase family protein [Vibrio sp. CK2-1]